MANKAQWSVSVPVKLDKRARTAAKSCGQTFAAWVRDAATRHLAQAEGVFVHLSDDERAAFAHKADSLGLTTSTYLKLLGRKDSGLPTL